MSLTIEAALWGALAGGALLLGALVGCFWKLPLRVTGAVMAFGIGVLISALAFELMHEAYLQGGLKAAVGGFVIGAVLYAIVNAVLAARGARARKKSTRSAGATGSMAIAVGSLLDGVPESAAIGISLLDGQGVALVTVLAVFISNVPEGLSSAVGMRRSGKTRQYVLLVWSSIASACALSAAAGVAFLASLGPTVTAGAVALAAGAILVMLVDTMIPEAFEELHAMSGPIAAVGFLLAFAASHSL